MEQHLDLSDMAETADTMPSTSTVEGNSTTNANPTEKVQLENGVESEAVASEPRSPNVEDDEDGDDLDEDDETFSNLSLNNIPIKKKKKKRRNKPKSKRGLVSASFLFAVSENSTDDDRCRTPRLGLKSTT